MSYKQKPKCYISGPMRNHEDFKYKHLNFDAFDTAKEEVRRMGYIPISPADLDRVHEGWGKYPPVGYKSRPRAVFECLRRDVLAILELVPSRGDAMYLMRGWENSRGVRPEYALAICLSLKIMYQEGAKEE